MRHRKSGRHLNRTASHRRAMFRNMAASLFLDEQLKTTLARAKELRRVAEPLITLAKKPNLANRRLAYARLRDYRAVNKLFDDLGVHFLERPGGYLRILKCAANRRGDNAAMAWVQLVDRDTAMSAQQEPRLEPGQVIEQEVQPDAADVKAEVKEQSDTKQEVAAVKEVSDTKEQDTKEQS